MSSKPRNSGLPPREVTTLTPAVLFSLVGNVHAHWLSPPALLPGWLHPCRTPRRDCDHRRARGLVASCGAGRARGGAADTMRQSSGAALAWRAIARRHASAFANRRLELVLERRSGSRF